MDEIIVRLINRVERMMTNTHSRNVSYIELIAQLMISIDYDAAFNRTCTSGQATASSMLSSGKRIILDYL